MKYPMMIKLIAVTGLVVAPLNAMASGFGGGWMQDKTTGTIYYSGAPSPERQQAVSDRQQPVQHLNSFGGGWVQDKTTSTIYYSRAPSPERQQAASDAQPSNQRLNGFGGGWVQDKHTNTLSYHPEHDAS